jgi:hypothetical protein
MPNMSHALRGARLFELVRAYASLGDHRSGSQVDHRTARWFAGMLESQGLVVEQIRVPFEHWTATSSVTIGDSEVEHLPLVHEWTGNIDTTDIAIIPFDPKTGGFPAVVDGPIAQAQADGVAAAVLVTEHSTGSLVAINRELHASRSNMPVVLAAGRDLEYLKSGDVRLTMSARVEQGHTVTVVARNAGAAADDRRVLLTTPLNGWFRCAGERGTGIAVLLDLVDRLADRPIIVVATGGHELGFFGAHRLVDEGTVRPGAVFHVGASVAVTDPVGHLIGTRIAFTSLDDDRARPIVDELATVELDLVTNATRWIGEGKAWSRIGCPVVSATGAGIDFHTPGDVPDRVTSPAALVRVADSFGRAAVHLADLIGTL